MLIMNPAAPPAVVKTSPAVGGGPDAPVTMAVNVVTASIVTVKVVVVGPVKVSLYA